MITLCCPVALPNRLFGRRQAAPRDDFKEEEYIVHDERSDENNIVVREVESTHDIAAVIPPYVDNNNLSPLLTQQSP